MESGADHPPACGFALSQVQGKPSAGVNPGLCLALEAEELGMNARPVGPRTTGYSARDGSLVSEGKRDRHQQHPIRRQ